MTHHRPKIHYHCDDWMNDPKLFYWEGEYHVFFQYKWPRHWGHIKSADLLHWDELPIALAPDAEGPDAEGGCWTGCCVRAFGRFHIFYTGGGAGGKQTTCHAVSDDLVTWTKNPANPVIVPSPPYNTNEGAAWRDPHVWEHGGVWFMAQCAEIGNQKTAVSGCVALMKSKDLQRWEMAPPLQVSGGMMMCECPDVFPLDGKYVGLFSCHKTFTMTSDTMLGKYRLNPNVSYMDDAVFYAGKTLLDEKHRRIMWGFLFENCGFESHFERWETFLSGRTWRNTLSFPRVLSLTEKGELASRLPEEFLSLRKKEIAWEMGESSGHWRMDAGRAVTGSPENDFAFTLLKNVKSDCFEITADITLDGAKKAGILVRCDAALARDVTGVSVCGQTGSVRIEDLGGGFEAPRIRLWDAFYTSPSMPVSMPVPGGTGKTARLRIIVDVSVVEVFINETACLTGRCYPEDAGSLAVGFFTVSGGAVFENTRVWELGL